MFRLSLTIGWLSACNSVLAVLVPWYVVTKIGANAETDAFFASSAPPQFIFLIISSTFAPILVPLFATSDEESFLNDARTFFLAVTVFFCLLAVVLLIAAEVWVPFLVSGFSAAGKGLALRLTKIQLISMVLNASIVTLWSCYQARQKFIWQEVSSLLANVSALLLLVYALPRFGIQAAAWAMVFNNSLKLILLLPILGRWRRLRWNTAIAAEAWRRLKPFLPGQIYLKTDPLLDRYLTSMTQAGGLSLFYVGQQVLSTVNHVLYKSVASTLAPALAIEAKEGAWHTYRRAYRQRLLMMLALTTAGVLLLLSVGLPASHLAIGHGGVTAENVRTLWLIMLSLAGVFVGGAALQVTSVAFYAIGDTKTPALLSATAYTIYIPLKVLVFLRYGLFALAVVMSVYFVVSFIAQFLALERAVRRRLGGGGEAFVGEEGSAAACSG
ncbi:MAG TPA: lipid II flippase MurJ [Pyrinomonadaceae bacterium]